MQGRSRCDVPRETAQERRVESRALKLQEIETQSPAEDRQMLHELRVHQIELEIQNEELRSAREQLEVSRAR